MADDLMDRLDAIDGLFYGCDEWCEGCAECAEPTQWVTREGEVINITKLETSHLVNILNFVRKQGVAGPVGRPRMNNLRREAFKRGCFERAGRWMPPRT